MPPTKLIPNSPYPLLHYPGLLAGKGELTAPKVYDILEKNDWNTCWIFRYGPTQDSHYHSKAHECMTVLTGTARVRFGVADTSSDLEESTKGNAYEEGGIVLDAKAGDVFILPAGTAHKTHDTTPATFTLLTPGTGHGIEADDPRDALGKIELTGFTMMGAYPKGGGDWDFAIGGENEGQYEKVWSVPMPDKDPFLGKSQEGLCGTWQSKLKAKL